MNINVSGDRLVTIDIELDLSSLEGIESRLSKANDILRGALKKVGDETRDTWVKNAVESLKSSDRYSKAVLQGASYPADNENTYSIIPNFRSISNTHNGKDLGLLLEDGYEPFDMKVKILKGSDRKIIHFKEGAPGSGERQTLPQSIFKMAKRHNRFQDYAFDAKRFPEIFGSSAYPNIANERRHKQFSIRNANNLTQKLSPGLTTRLASQGWAKDEGFMTENKANALEINYKWKKGRYQGLVSKNGGKSFSLFRSISPKSAPDSWIHPGMVPKLIFKNTMDTMKPKIQEEFEKALDAILGQ